jgi:hypothetical protein
MAIQALLSTKVVLPKQTELSNLISKKIRNKKPPPLNLIALCNLTTAEESPFSMA